MSRARAEIGMRIGALLVALLLAGRISASAQLPSPRLDSCYPLGACAGSEVDVVLAGADLDETKVLVFDTDKIAAVRVDNLKFRVSVRGDCPPGRYEVRLAGRYGISTPLPFRVDDLCEAVESESNHSREKADLLSVPQVVHGKCQAEQRDFFRFTAREGERVEIVCSALELDSPMDPVVTVQNANGSTMARGDDERDRDVHLQFVVPRDGAYFIAVHDKLYAGGANHLYRLTVRDSPARLSVDSGAEEWCDARSLRSVIEETEPNDAAGSAQTITPPVELRGRFDVDWFQFQAEGGKPLWIEIVPETGTNGRDPLIVVQKVVPDGSGAGQMSQVLELDDQPELPGPPLWQFASRDPAGRFVPDVTGIYRLRVHDRARTRESYRLVIHEATPDFSLVVLAESPANEEKKIFKYQPNLRRGGSAYFHVAARRRGYDGEILLRANGLPPGMTVHGSIPAGAPTGIIAFHAAADAPAWAGHIRLVGEGGGVAREARGSHYRWNVENRDNQRVASRPARPALAIVEEAAPFAVVAAEEKTWEAPPKGDLEIAVRLERPNSNAKPKGEWELVPIGLPGLKKSAPLKFDAAAANDAKIILPLQRDGNSVAPGTYTLLLRARGTVSYKADGKASARDVKHVEFSRPIVIQIPPFPAPSAASPK